MIDDTSMNHGDNIGTETITCTTIAAIFMYISIHHVWVYKSAKHTSLQNDAWCIGDEMLITKVDANIANIVKTAALCIDTNMKNNTQTS